MGKYWWVRDYWFYITCLTAPAVLLLARALGAPVSGWLIAAPPLTLVVVLAAAIFFMQLYMRRHADEDEVGIPLSSLGREVHTTLSGHELEVMEPVRDADNRLDIDATLLQLRSQVGWVRLIPGARKALRQRDDILRVWLEDLKRREEG